MPHILGRVLDEAGRCAHWHSERDILSIQFPCCGEFWACRECHDELADHPAEVWPNGRFDAQALMCGVCRATQTITDYLMNPNACPSCGAEFNPGCASHHPLYFEV